MSDRKVIEVLSITVGIDSDGESCELRAIVGHMCQSLPTIVVITRFCVQTESELQIQTFHPRVMSRSEGNHVLRCNLSIASDLQFKLQIDNLLIVLISQNTQIYRLKRY